MFERLGRVVMRARYAVVAIWLLAAVASVVAAPSLAKVGSADETSFLPTDAESMVARHVLADAFPGSSSLGIATVIVSRPSGLTAADRAYVDATADWLASKDAPDPIRTVVSGVHGAADQPDLASLYRSADGQVELLSVQLSVSPFERAAKDGVAAIRSHLESSRPAGLETHVSGTAGIGSDYLQAIADGTDRTTIVTIVLVVAILLLIYRAPIAALVPLLTIGAAFIVSRGILGELGQAGWKIPTLLESFVVVLVFGVGTDYTIFLISRLREELGRAGGLVAGATTVGRIGPVITASAATVVVGLGSMFIARFGIIQSIGPALAISIVVTLAAGLTLAPALLAIAGRWLFWPLHTANGNADGGLQPLSPSAVGDSDRPSDSGAWARIAGWITTRPGLAAAAVIVVLALPFAGLLGLRTSFDVLEELPSSADARAGFDIVAAHFDKGQLLPVNVLLRGAPGTGFTDPAGLAAVARATDAVRAIDGVESVRSLVDPAGSGSTTAGLRPSARLAEMAQGFRLPGDLSAALSRLLDPATGQRISAAGAYLSALAPAYPDVANRSDYTGATADLASLQQAIGVLRGGAIRPGSAEAARLTATLGQVGGRLPAELTALSAWFAARPDDLFLPLTTSGNGAGSASAMASTFVSAAGDVTRMYVVTTDDPYSVGAFETVERVRSALEDLSGTGPVASSYVGGSTAEFADVRTTINEDFRRVSAITVAGVMLVLVLLLRSIVAPIYLVLSVLLSFGTSLGLGSVLFQGVLGQAGMNYFIPLIVFVLLVALGSDYNIFLMSRVREESATRDLRSGIRVASGRTGAVITSAGIILAGTFGALGTAPLQILFQTGVTVSLGVLIDTFLVRSLLIPAVTALLGEVSWWPFGGVGRRQPVARVPR